MNKLLIIFSLVALMGCTKQTSEVNEFVLPTGLSDCRVFRMDNGRLTHVVVVRCPNSTTSVHKGGKHQWNTTTIDENEAPKATITINGKEYIEQ
jgi:hypothetical protein